MNKLAISLLLVFLGALVAFGQTICTERCSPTAGCPNNCEDCDTCGIFGGVGGGTTACVTPAGVSPSPSTSVGLKTPCNRCGKNCVFAVGNRQCENYSNNTCTQCTPVQSGGAFCTRPTALRRNSDGVVEPISTQAFIRAQHPEWSDSQVTAQEFFLTWRHARLTSSEGQQELESLLFDQETKQGRKNLAAWKAGLDGVSTPLGAKVLLAVQAYNRRSDNVEVDEEKTVPVLGYIKRA